MTHRIATLDVFVPKRQPLKRSLQSLAHDTKLAIRKAFLQPQLAFADEYGDATASDFQPSPMYVVHTQPLPPLSGGPTLLKRISRQGETLEKGINFGKFLEAQYGKTTKRKEGDQFTDPRTGRVYEFREGRWRSHSGASAEKVAEAAVPLVSAKSPTGFYLDDDGNVRWQSGATARFHTKAPVDHPLVIDYLRDLYPLAMYAGVAASTDDLFIDRGLISENEINAINAVRAALLAHAEEITGLASSDDEQMDYQDVLATLLQHGGYAGGDPTKPVGQVDDFLAIHQILASAVDESDLDADTADALKDLLAEGWSTLARKYANAVESVYDPAKRREDQTGTAIYAYLNDAFSTAQKRTYATSLTDKLESLDFANSLLFGDDLSNDEKNMRTLLAFLGDYEGQSEQRYFSHYGRDANGKIKTTPDDSAYFNKYAYRARFADEGKDEKASYAQEVFNTPDAMFLAMLGGVDANYPLNANLDLAYEEREKWPFLKDLAEEYAGDDNDVSEYMDEIAGLVIERLQGVRALVGEYNKGTGQFALTKLLASSKNTLDAASTASLRAMAEEQKAATVKIAKMLEAQNDTNAVVQGDTFGVRDADGNRNPNFLYDYQKKYLNWMVTAKRGVVAADTGLGKTPMGVAFVDHLIATGKAKRGILVLPPALMEQWPSEIESFRPGSKVISLGEGVSQADRQLIIEQINAGKLACDFLLLSSGVFKPDNTPTDEVIYDALGNAKPAKSGAGPLLDALRACEGALLVDEYHAGGYKTGPRDKKPGSSTYLALNHALGEREYRFGMTATPIPNSLTDLVTLLKTMNPEALGPNPDVLLSQISLPKFNRAEGAYTFDNPAAYKQLQDAIRPYCFTMKKTDEAYLKEMGSLVPDVQLNERYKNPIEQTLPQKKLTALLSQADASDVDWPEIFEALGVPKNKEGKYPTLAQVQATDPETGEPVWEMEDDGKTQKLDADGEPIPKMRSMRSPAEAHAHAMSLRQGDYRLAAAQAKSTAILIMRKAALAPALLFENKHDPSLPASIHESPKADACVHEILEHFNNPSNFHAESGAYKPVVVFAEYSSAFQVIKERLKAAGLRDDQIGIIASTDGESAVSKAKRASIQDAINDGKMPVVFVGMKAGGAGLNLQRTANHIMYLDKPLTPDLFIQTFGRVRRTGYQRPKAGGAFKQYEVRDEKTGKLKGGIPGFHNPDEKIKVTMLELAGFEHAALVPNDVDGVKKVVTQKENLYKKSLGQSFNTLETKAETARMYAVKEYATNRVAEAVQRIQAGAVKSETLALPGGAAYTLSPGDAPGEVLVARTGAGATVTATVRFSGADVAKRISALPLMHDHSEDAILSETYLASVLPAYLEHAHDDYRTAREKLTLLSAEDDQAEAVAAEQERQRAEETKKAAFKRSVHNVGEAALRGALADGEMRNGVQKLHTGIIRYNTTGNDAQKEDDGYRVAITEKTVGWLKANAGNSEALKALLEEAEYRMNTEPPEEYTEDNHVVKNFGHLFLPARGLRGQDAEEVEELSATQRRLTHGVTNSEIRYARSKGVYKSENGLTSLSEIEGAHADIVGDTHPSYATYEPDARALNEARHDWTLSIDDWLAQKVGDKAVLSTALESADSEEFMKSKIGETMQALFGSPDGYMARKYATGVDFYNRVAKHDSAYRVDGRDLDERMKEVLASRKHAEAALTQNPQSQAFDFGEYHKARVWKQRRVYFQSTLQTKASVLRAKLNGGKLKGEAKTKAEDELRWISSALESDNALRSAWQSLYGDRGLPKEETQDAQAPQTASAASTPSKRPKRDKNAKSPADEAPPQTDQTGGPPTKPLPAFSGDTPNAQPTQASADAAQETPKEAPETAEAEPKPGRRAKAPKTQETGPPTQASAEEAPLKAAVEAAEVKPKKVRAKDKIAAKESEQAPTQEAAPIQEQVKTAGVKPKKKPTTKTHPFHAEESERTRAGNAVATDFVTNGANAASLAYTVTARPEAFAHGYTFEDAKNEASNAKPLTGKKLKARQATYANMLGLDSYEDINDNADNYISVAAAAAYVGLASSGKPFTVKELTEAMTERATSFLPYAPKDPRVKKLGDEEFVKRSVALTLAILTAHGYLHTEIPADVDLAKQPTDPVSFLPAAKPKKKSK